MVRVSVKLGALCLTAFAAHAQVHESDVMLAIREDAIATGVFSGGQFEPARVFVSTLGEAFPNFATDPGFDCAPGTFPAGSRIGFTLRGRLRTWSDTCGCFEAREEPPVMFVDYFGGALHSETPPDDSTVTGFTIAVGANGQWHRHLEYTLQPPAEQGVYLMEMTLYSTSPLIGASEPFWIVFNQNADPSLVASAADWVVENLASPPAPCIADFNNDEGVDDLDITAFFAAFEAGDADVNGDDGVDDLDISAFFLAFESGC